MSEKKSNEALDTLQFTVPKSTSSNAEKTKIYNSGEIKNAGRTQGKTVKPVRRQSSGNTQSSRQQPVRKSTPPAPQRTYHSAQTAPAAGKNYETAPARPVRKKRRSSPAAAIIRNIIILIAALFCVYSAACLSYIGKTSKIEGSGQYSNDPETMLYSSDVTNILVMGTDARSTDTRGLSDSMILISLNKKNHKIQMTSLMRDMYLPVEGYGWDKLNAAYSYGGAPLLKDTVEDNFRIRIDGCVTVNFQSVVYAVDAVGGVNITLSDSEAQAINDILYCEVNEIMGDDPYDDFLESGGTYKLNGKQALSYSRIRYVGDADFERTERQRTVITQILSAVKFANPLTLNKNMSKAMPYIGTDMKTDELYKLCLRAPLLLAFYKPEQLRVPFPDTWWYSETDDGMSIIETDTEANTEILRNKIYLAE